MSGHRLPSGGLIDRDTGLSFRFDGKDYRGHPGDSLASALIASGVTLFGRSFKYHRRRGVFAFGADEPNALVTLREGARAEPNLKATTVELYDGLVAASQNRWPSLDHDVMAVNGLLSRLFVAGFYYKTFKWPSALWEKLYEPVIRRAAGLGAASGLPDPDSYETVTAHCDVLVVGAGPAGLMAALSAARSGARVILATADTRLGGQLLAERHAIDGRPGAEFAAGIAAELATMPDVRILTRTSVFGAYDGGSFGALEKVADHLPVPPDGLPRQRLWTLLSRQSIIAVGSTERPIVLSGNDLPGVMLAGASRSYAVRNGVSTGRRTAIFTANDAGWQAAADLAACGVSLAAVIDPRADVSPALTSALAGVRTYTGARVREALGAKTLERIVIDKANGSSEVLDVDGLGLSGGFQPSIQLTGHLGGRPVWRDDLGAFGHGPLPKGMQVAGSAAGTMT
ncbi:2Fe-2S iron-sulfur cluster-binding protein, partial [Methylobrevis pamukkalensis]|uniref:2Fe-2S iron-sulfur cluster-binding protein n=1 Tax=Methylobrevis pamukkalensis TaxID=1439726 RepID=UPI00114D061F